MPKTDKEWARYWVAKYIGLVNNGNTWWQVSLDRARSTLRALE